MNGRAFVFTGVQQPFNEAFANADQGKAVRTALICAPDLVSA